MACPFFDPAERLDDRSSTRPARFSLGDPYSGICLADSAAPYSPGAEELVAWCNRGHARGECARFPAGPAPDAANFIVSRDEGGLVEIRFAVQRDHRPLAHGALQYSVRERAFLAQPEPPWIGRQAAAYVRSYLRRVSP